MRVPENWLRSFVDVKIKTSELAHLLTMSGLEVESCEPVAPPLKGVVVGKVLAVEKHPNADKLTVCSVDTGREKFQVVCGAPNVRAGMLAPLALAGANLNSLEIKRRSRPILFIADVLQPIRRLAVKRLLNGEMRHRSRWASSVPMLFARRK